MLPEPLLEALRKEAGGYPARALAQAADALSEAYRSGRPFHFGADEQRVAYAVVRLPATYAVLTRVLAEVRGRVPGIASLLDLGAGPGAAAWAAGEVFGELGRSTLIEEDRRLAELGKKLGAGGDWRVADIRAVSFEPHDLVTLSYVLAEFEEEESVRLLRRAWNATARALAVIEPGTQRGFGRIRRLRAELTAMGAYIAAPCPHAAACPMAGGDWCHFARRLERTALHRALKRGALGHEDEKYSFVVASREPAPAGAARILRHPQRYPGHVKLRLCTPEGLRDQVVTRSQRDAWRAARQSSWGDALESLPQKK